MSRYHAGQTLDADTRRRICDTARTEGLATSEVAERYGVTSPTVLRSLRRAGEPREVDEDGDLSQLVDRAYLRFWNRRGMRAPPVSSCVVFSL